MQKLIQKTGIVICGVLLAVAAFFWSGYIANSGVVAPATQVVVSE